MKKILIVAVALLLALSVLLGYKFSLWYIDNKKPNFSVEETVLEVTEGDDADTVLKEIVERAGVLREKSLARAFKDKRVKDYIQAGRYVIKPSFSSVYVARMLNNCWQTPVNLVLSGTMRSKEVIAGKIGGQMMVDKEDVLAALCDDEFLSGFGFNAQNVFSLFIPDTYEIYWTSDVEDIFKKMKGVYDSFWTSENIQKAKDLGLSKEEVSTLASIVSAETNYEPEMPSVAGVYLNRLKIGMRLQADPTVAFCFNYEPTRILNKHLEVDSPYNTYKYPGLPPGPICVPSRAALNAVLNPDKHEYVYFCANSDFSGTHKFASSFSEHMKNAREFQAALNKLQAASR